MKILAIIPARGGSKGIPYKNIYPLAGKPLLAWTIEATKSVKLIDKIVVSSDDDKILGAAKEYGAEAIKRPAEISGDNSPFSALIFHALDFLKAEEKYEPDILIYLQPTSPLREAGDIDQALALMDEKTEGVISAYEVDNKLLKSFVINKDGFMEGAINDDFPFMNRQDLPKTYMPNGAIYIIRTESFLKTGKLFSDKTKLFLMDKSKSLDIDSVEDVKKAEETIKKK